MNARRATWTRRALVLLAAATLTTGAQATQYIFDVGSDKTDMSGSRCRTGKVSDQALVSHAEGKTTVLSSAPGAVTLFCPTTRRATSYPGHYDNTPTISTDLSVTYIDVRATDANASNSVSCKPFVKGVAGSVTYGSTRYACSGNPDMGCDTAPAASWTGSGNIVFLAPFPVTSTLNHGIMCTVPRSSSVNYYSVEVNPN